jgi:hypothetical protein
LLPPGNRFDEPFLPKLIEDLEAEYVLADRAYHSKTKFKAARAINAIPIIANNPTKKGRSRKTEAETHLSAKRLCD